MKKLRNFKLILQYLKDDKFVMVLYVILVLLTYVPALFSAYFWGKALENLLIKNVNGFVLFLGIWIGVFILCFTVVQFFKDKLYNYLEIKFTKNVILDLYKKIDKLPAIAFEEIGVGEYINRLHNDTDRVMSLLSSLIKLICKALVVVFVVIVCFHISVILGIEIMGFAIGMGFISWYFFPRIKKTQEEIKKESDLVVKKATENITGIREIKALGIRKIIENDIQKVVDELFNHEKNIRSYEVVYYALNNLAYFILEVIILYTAGKFFIEGKIVYALFTVIQTFIWRIDDVVESISDFGVNFNKISVSLKRIDELLNNRLYEDEKFGNKVLKNPKGIIEFKDVKFKYREDEEYTLKGLNLKIEPNKKVAIVGRSGNGKSTIFNLLLRYFDASEGEILIDGTNIKDLTEESLRNSISIIRQSPFLFNLSIFDNFKYVKEDVTLKEIRKVCKEAYIDDYIMSLPKQYDTIIGEGGVNLSGGQKQRIAIARTLLLNTKIILFDEATSALDNESQDYIKKSIDSLVKDHTIVIVAHRLSTIVDADIINVIEKGRLVSSGKHNHLLKNSKTYKSLYKSETLNN